MHPSSVRSNHLRRAGSGCPYCSGRKPCACRSLAVTHPQLSAQWHHELNRELRPADVSAGSGKAAWWRCPTSDCKHEWQAQVFKRSQGNGCPQCGVASRAEKQRELPLLLLLLPVAAIHELELSSRQPTLCAAGQPTLAEGRPDLLASWHPRNGSPGDVRLGSQRSVWWQCSGEVTGNGSTPCGHLHEWQTRISQRVLSGCPICTGRKPCWCNSLARLHPELVKQWDEAANAPLRPEDLLPGSNKRVHWVCSKHKEPCHFRTTVQARTRANSTGCPQCFSERQLARAALLRSHRAAAADGQ